MPPAGSTGIRLQWFNMSVGHIKDEKEVGGHSTQIRPFPVTHEDCHCAWWSRPDAGRKALRLLRRHTAHSQLLNNINLTLIMSDRPAISKARGVSLPERHAAHLEDTINMLLVNNLTHDHELIPFCQPSSF